MTTAIGRRARSTACSSTASPRPNACATSPVVPERRKLKVVNTTSKMIAPAASPPSSAASPRLADDRRIDQAEQRRRQIGERHRHGDRENEAVGHVERPRRASSRQLVPTQAPWLEALRIEGRSCTTFSEGTAAQLMRQPASQIVLAVSNCSDAAADRPPSGLRRQIRRRPSLSDGQVPAADGSLRRRGLASRRQSARARAGRAALARSLLTRPPMSSR